MVACHSRKPVKSVIPAQAIQSVFPAQAIQSVFPAQAIQSVIPARAVQSVIPAKAGIHSLPSHNRNPAMGDSLLNSYVHTLFLIVDHSDMEGSPL